MQNKWRVYKDNIIVFSLVIGMFAIPVFLCLIEFLSENLSFQKYILSKFNNAQK
ncbi:hypothetical protein J73031_00006 [Listeria monocytogenes]|nr:hypothetical protein J73031_00006 [Listeria monocytogenes]